MGTLTGRPVPTRTCVSCRTGRDKRALLRVVRTPAGSVMLDVSGRANGRGAYVCRDASCIERAVTRGALGRALEVPVPKTLGIELRMAAGLQPESAATSPGDRADHDDNQED